jgi:transposase
MFSLSSSSRIFIHALPTDMRKSFDALCGIVKGEFKKDILDGDYFVFFNRILDRCKILLWDRDGLILIYKRLEKGCFQRPVNPSDAGMAIEVDLTTLTLILNGIDLSSAKRRKRFQDSRAIALIE